MPHRETPEDWPALARQLGQRVRQLREDRKKQGDAPRFTQEGLAHEAGISRNHVQNIENARNNTKGEDGRPGVGNPGVATLLAISRALDVELLDLLPDGLLPESVRHRPWTKSTGDSPSTL
ncbi:helix-turn-helix domain-containing protein [Jiangella mangrovi]|uniref:Transcriptional regulator with XRE-family HTH domain n=1 Tax=Jiangella mangrovi TaxID=1524084 RepID=A0A7W9LPR7_9ACTN|nr:transcriptional regulator with XRE-family HTH domain [Jiangella mangrovi]